MTVPNTTLTPECGHHCGTVPVGGAEDGSGGTMTKHCPCAECHDNKEPVYIVDDTDPNTGEVFSRWS